MRKPFSPFSVIFVLLKTFKKIEVDDKKISAMVTKRTDQLKKALQKVEKEEENQAQHFRRETRQRERGPN